MSIGDNRLAMLADDIRKIARSIDRNAEKIAHDAIEAGQRLIEAKALLKHGQWGSWLRENCDLNPRTARLYMQLARAGVENGNVAILGVRGGAGDDRAGRPT